MKRLILILTTVVAGCGSIDSLVSNMPCPGHRPYDPQLCRGEKPARIPNFKNEAQRIMERCGSIGPDCPGAQK